MNSNLDNNEVTQLLALARDGDGVASNRLWDVVHQELRAIAGQQMAGEHAAKTLQATALVHEAYLRLFGSNQIDWANRQHFFATAAKVMRQICVDDARRRRTLKRGGGNRPVPLEDGPPVLGPDPAIVLDVHEALELLEKDDPKKAQIVTLRYFAGLNEEEAAEVMGLSRRTVQLEWRVARAWLHRRLGGLKLGDEDRDSAPDA